ncbi:hypothetical protein FOXB_08131 [Fusarium oxysporum f. sp. conglutinans Fo5176]|uniref:Uncharacterized protein n=1 Tax=Fusarium oxysporum (strain Fo5176) TaxID=660025 RepID=F9FP01_FUSOF|nr:hypothetical protein FOXB_08131 [Fusarium oxysporum f. sp. conglutinans Fo5176]
MAATGNPYNPPNYLSVIHLISIAIYAILSSDNKT